LIRGIGLIWRIGRIVLITDSLQKIPHEKNENFFEKYLAKHLGFP